jgi:hypothetical protein
VQVRRSGFTGHGGQFLGHGAAEFLDGLADFGSDFPVGGGTKAEILKAETLKWRVRMCAEEVGGGADGERTQLARRSLL